MMEKVQSMGGDFIKTSSKFYFLGAFMIGAGDFGGPADGKKIFRSLRCFAMLVAGGACLNGSSTLNVLLPFACPLVTRICPFRFRTYRAMTPRSFLSPFASDEFVAGSLADDQLSSSCASSNSWKVS